ncbi:MAG: 3-isopropylmalate dehydratase large subunit [Candidatus Omnitrophica bacterium]|nr:3-isopropylmalate dehydratase large subunit [Candidatus Omnitrophota bacterium]MCF7894523.1 3-isopropylmalate dehydratase large subunit [Candidatus Omnitrophota bacterium]
MGLTLIEKILKKKSINKRLDNFIYAKIDFCFGNDITAPLAAKIFEKAKFNSVYNPRKVGFFCDHFVPARDQKAANNVKKLKEFAKKFKIKNFYDTNTCGIEHVFLPEKGLVKTGDLVIGADSHTCTYGALGAASFGIGSTDLAAAIKEGTCWFRKPETIKFVYSGKIPQWFTGKDLILYTIGKIGVSGALYKVMEFGGPVIRALGMEDRFTICNMAIEAGAQTGIIEPDKKTVKFIKKVNPRIKKVPLIKSDKDANYYKVMKFDISLLKPQIACPHLPSNVVDVDKLKKVSLDQVVIGSCTNGRLKDLGQAAEALKGKTIKKGLRAIVIPGSHKVYGQAFKKGYLDIFHKAGFMVSPPTCGPCLGGHTGILDKGEVALATTNRNFIGRMGHPESFVYLSNPAVAAASSITGKITHPAEIVKKVPMDERRRMKGRRRLSS